MSEDKELAMLIEANDDVIQSIIESDSTGYSGDEESRNLQYAEDLGLLLSTSQGIRVLRHWLDMAGFVDKTFQTDANVYRNAALRDYAQDRMTEICAASPKGYLKLMLDGAKEAAIKAVDSTKEHYSDD